MKLDTIIRTAEEIRASYGDTSDPAALCESAGVILLYFPMGDCRIACMGFILAQKGRTSITVNCDLSRDLRRVVMYHELGHYFMHVRTGLIDHLQDFTVGHPRDDLEYEADMLAAEISLQDEEGLSTLTDNGDFYTTAECLLTTPELLDMKLQLMRHKGFRIPDAPIRSSGGYLRKLDGSSCISA